MKKAKVPMSDTALSLRVPLDMVKRLDALIQAVASDAASQGFTRVSRSVVAKRALAEGLRVLEERFFPAKR